MLYDDGDYGVPQYVFFLIELSSLNHPCHWVIGGHKKNFSVIDSKMSPLAAGSKLVEQTLKKV